MPVRMKRFLFRFVLCAGFLALFSLLSGSLAFAAQGFVDDRCSYLSSFEQQKLAAIGEVLQKRTKAELVFVSVPNLDGQSVEMFALSLFEDWGLGDRDLDNGVLLLVAQQERKIRIEVGYGLEGALPDAYCGDVIRAMVKRFQADGYREGIVAAYLTLVQRIAEEYGLALDDIVQNVSSDDLLAVSASKGSGLLGEIIFFIVFLLFLSGRMGLLPFLFISSMSGRGSYWNSGGGGFGGGFGGFGGGSSGGGGASGGW